MKLSKTTITVLKNFAGLNPNLLLKPGNHIVTRCGDGLLADAEVEETFPIQFGIYDLNEFLAILSMFDSPDIEFDDKKVVVKEDRRKVTHYGAGAGIVKECPVIDLATLPAPDIEFDLPASTFQQVQKAASVLKVPDFFLLGDDGKITLQIADKRNSTSNSFENVVGETDKEFRVSLRVEDFRFLPLDYRCSIRKKKIAVFEATSQSLRYFNAIGKDSTFEF